MPVRNILFVMADQLRADYLSCAGHPSLATPNIDALAVRGVRFGRAYVQAPVCGPSRMSFYTGRYVGSHGSTYNGVPLRVGEMTMGDHLRPLGLQVALVGKTHMVADGAGLERLGVDPRSIEGVLASECGFEPFERDDGLWPDRGTPPDLRYNNYLRKLGYAGENPWHDYANAALGPGGERKSGWDMRNAREPARVKEEHSETAYMTDRAMEFIAQAGTQPWCLHLSYIKPHWPYMAPAPYHALYGPADVIAPNRSDAERRDPHPVYAAFMRHEESVNFARDEVRATVIPTYMGLIKQIDDHLGRLWRFLEERYLFEQTMIVVTSDHGDYLGDHWLGEKELFHEESVRVPLIIYDPDPAANQTRGSVNDALVEAIDLLPTFVAAAGGAVPSHVLEGRSLLPIVRPSGGEGPWRDAVFSECDYSFRAARRDLAVTPGEARATMVRTGRWKYVLYEGFRPQLFDLAGDPRELCDLGADPQFESVRRELEQRLFTWTRHRRNRLTISDAEIEKRTNTHKERGFPFGVW
ncbi:MAG TPA: alkaline phosphatase family protein [Xanthobacteraceae bacterium]|jgi:arylsulfatase A-like enzyme